MTSRPLRYMVRPGLELRYSAAGWWSIATVVRLVRVADGPDLVLVKNPAGRLLTFDLRDVYEDEFGRLTVEPCPSLRAGRR